MRRKDGGGPHEEDGGQSQYWDGFTGGITAPTPKFKIPENDPPRARYGDSWQATAMNIKIEAPTGFDKSRL